MTLKQSVQSYMHLHKTYHFIDVLQDIVHSYNHTQHYTIGISPSELKPDDMERNLWWHLYKPKEVFYKWKACKVAKLKYKRGDKVQITHSAKTFQRAYDENWTPEIFVICQGFYHQGIKKYRLDNLDGEEIKRTFYEPKLQLVKYNPDRAFTVEREINSVGVGCKRQILVKWAGWPDKFNSWITQEHYEKIHCRR